MVKGAASDLSAVSETPEQTEEKEWDFSQDFARSQSQPDKQYPADPVAALAVVTDETVVDAGGAPKEGGLLATTSSQSPPDRIPLWSLAPGVGILQGSTSNSMGVKLSDFSAINLIHFELNGISHSGSKTLTTKETGPLDSSPIDLNDLAKALLPVSPVSHRSPMTPLMKKSGPALNDPRKMPARSASSPAISSAPTIRLTPPNNAPPTKPMLEDVVGAQSWPARKSRVAGWRIGRKEHMEDVIDEALPFTPGFGSGSHSPLTTDEEPSVTADPKVLVQSYDGMDDGNIDVVDMIFDALLD